jgi:hypothetical protein
MNMKDHILSALREQFVQWEELLSQMSEDQITAPLLPSAWSTKDVLAHLMAWQQRSIARMEAAVLDREPVFPSFLPELEPDSEASTDQINAWFYETHCQSSWSRINQDWRAGFFRFLESGEAITEKDLLDSGRYRWLKGYPLAFILVASYDHHQEHYEKLLAWLQEHK